MRSFDTSIIAPALALVLAAGGCASAASELRPDGLSAGAAIGESFVCSNDKLKGDLSPFTADWSDGERAALEAAMKRGVAVVSMSCEGPKVLKACMVGGDYSYSGISKKTKLVKMEDLGSAAVNFGGGVFSPSIKSELSQGRSLDLAYLLVGVESTSVVGVSPTQLKGRCEGATHFVFEAQLGAFALETAERGDSRVAADLLIGTTNSETSSSKSSRSTDGDPAACSSADETDRSKTQGCSALLRVELMSLSDTGETQSKTSEQGAVRVVGCPNGYTWDGDACQPEQQVAYTLCDDFDKAGCLEQCKLGSVESCNRFANSLLFDLILESAVLDSNEEVIALRGEWSKGLVPHVQLLSQACDEEMPDACTVLGFHYSYNEYDDDIAVKHFAVGCVLGDPYACSSMVREGALLARSTKVDALDTACRRGVAQACGLWVEEIALDIFEGSMADPRVAEMAGRACYGGLTNYCPIAAAFYQDDASCPETLVYGTWSAGYDIELEFARELCGTYSPVVDDDAFAAELLLNAGCDYGNASVCERLVASYGEFELPELDLSDIDLEGLELE